uniref:TGF-beta family profile domain-containing protein n=1 Tax=Mola mola TaxID=94237 RepID=A0A3Q3XFQ2_MOLML
MKLWKGATFAFMLCGAALSVLLIRNMATLGRLKPKTKHLYASSSSTRRSSSSGSASEDSLSSLAAAPAESTVLSRQMRGLHRRARSADDINSLLSESTMLQSFTEAELQHVVGTLLDRKQRRSRRLGGNQARRTKRARRQNLCSLRKVELTVSELGLGYDSDETLLLHYCSGTCTAHRHNYDISMKHIKGTVFKKKGLNDKVSNGPCCRPTAFEKEFSFLDNKSRYHMVQNVSAKNCGCV